MKLKLKPMVYISLLIVSVLILQAAVGAEPGAKTFPGQRSGASVETGKALHRHLAK
jgi:hypothetical protein